MLAADPARLKEDEERRVANIKRAYDLAKQAASSAPWLPDMDFLCRVHAAVTEGLTHIQARNRPGVLRDNPKHVVAEVGSDATGGRYKPPQYGRVIEAAILLAAGYRYAPFALYYLDEITRYFSLFNTRRRKAQKKAPHANEDIVLFHLEGMLKTIHLLHARVNQLIKVLLFESRARRLADDKTINARQHAIVHRLMESGRPLARRELADSPWYAALYAKLSDKTRRRDLDGLRDTKLVVSDEAGRLWPGWAD